MKTNTYPRIQRVDMKFVQFTFIYLLLPVVTCVESMRNVESNQKNVHRTHMFSKLHKTNVIFSAKRMLQHDRKSIHSIRSNKKKQENTVYVGQNNNHILKWKERNAKRMSVNNLRKRYSNFSFVNIPYQMTFEMQIDNYDARNINAGERSKEFISASTWKKESQDDWKRNVKRKENTDHRHVFKREAPVLRSSAPVNDAAEIPESSVSKPSVASTTLPVPSPALLAPNPEVTTLALSQAESDDNADKVITPGTGSTGNTSTNPNKSITPPNRQDLVSMSTQKHVDDEKLTPTRTNAASDNRKTLHHSMTTRTVIKPTKLESGGAKSTTISQKAPSTKPILVTTVQRQQGTSLKAADMTLPIQKPTADGTNSNVEELEERTSETECKDGQCPASFGPSSRFSDAAWAMGSMTFILLLLTGSVLYTGLWKKRNQFIYGFKSREDATVSQQFNKTNVSDMLRRLNSTKKKEMIRLKRMFGSKYNRVPLAEGSDIEEEDDSSV